MSPIPLSATTFERNAAGRASWTDAASVADVCTPPSPMRPTLEMGPEVKLSCPNVLTELLVPHREAMIRVNLIRFFLIISFSLSDGLRTVRIIGSVGFTGNWGQKGTCGKSFAVPLYCLNRNFGCKMLQPSEFGMNARTKSHTVSIVMHTMETLVVDRIHPLQYSA